MTNLSLSQLSVTSQLTRRQNTLIACTSFIVDSTDNRTAAAAGHGPRVHTSHTTLTSKHLVYLHMFFFDVFRRRAVFRRYTRVKPSFWLALRCSLVAKSFTARTFNEISCFARCCYYCSCWGSGGLWHLVSRGVSELYPSQSPAADRRSQPQVLSVYLGRSRRVYFS